MQFAWRLEVIARDDLRRCPRWQVAFASERKDHRYYELVEDTLVRLPVFRDKGRGWPGLRRTAFFYWTKTCWSERVRGMACSSTPFAGWDR
jgi:hypothetical protein